MNIFITPRISLDKNSSVIYSLEKNWIDFSKRIGFNLLIVSDFKILKEIFSNFNPKGLIVTGGGDIYKKNKNFLNKIRDQNEKGLINFFKKKKLPILTVCRGSQLIYSENRVKLYKIENHVKKNHTIYNVSKNKKFKFKKINTNSFHNYGVRDLKSKFEKIAVDKNHYVEISKLNNSNIYLLMFHPERKNKDQKIIDNFIKKIFRII
jgi:gamma-glutamyl-gamma-aminobutyrate hydrolase PuuD